MSLVRTRGGVAGSASFMPFESSTRACLSEAGPHLQYVANRLAKGVLLFPHSSLFDLRVTRLRLPMRCQRLVRATPRLQPCRFHTSTRVVLSTYYLNIYNFDVVVTVLSRATVTNGPCISKLRKRQLRPAHSCNVTFRYFFS